MYSDEDKALYAKYFEDMNPTRELAEAVAQYASTLNFEFFIHFDGFSVTVNLQQFWGGEEQGLNWFFSFSDGTLKEVNTKGPILDPELMRLLLNRCRTGP